MRRSLEILLFLRQDIIYFDIVIIIIIFIMIIYIYVCIFIYSIAVQPEDAGESSLIPGQILSAALSHSGLRLAISDDYKTCKVWDISELPDR